MASRSRIVWIKMYRMAVPMCEAIRFLLFGFGDCLVGPGAPPSGLVREFAKGSDAIPSVQFGNLPEVLGQLRQVQSGSLARFLMQFRQV